MNTYPLENRNGGNAGRRGRRPTNGFSALTGGADCFQDGREGGRESWSSMAMVDGWSGRMTGARGSREGGKRCVTVLPRVEC